MLAFCCFALVALEVALNMPLSNEHWIPLEWLGITTALVFSTVQTEDIAYKVDDRIISLPSIFGDNYDVG